VPPGEAHPADPVDEVLDAVLDGTPLDWERAESGSGGTSAFLKQLRVVAAVAAVHRAASPQEPELCKDDRSSTEQKVDFIASVWGHLRILERVGSGSFGEVYRAWDTRLDREVALKLLPATPSATDRAASSLIDEGRLLARVRHPNVVTIYGAEQISCRIGLWMEFVRGRTLEQILHERKALGAAEVISIGFELCRAVSAVHGAGLLHRDIKAHNVMRADDGRIVLMDFGTGREIEQDTSLDLAGTPLYLAPEVLKGQPASIHSDLYSLGVLLYRLLTGSYPVQAQTVAGVRHLHERGQRVPIRVARPSVPRKLACVIDRALDPDPARRYRSVEAMATHLTRTKRPPWLAQIVASTTIAAAVLLLVGISWEALGRQVESPEIPSTLLERVVGWKQTPVVSALDQPIIAVLPFRNLSVETQGDDFADGLTNEIIGSLAIVRGLQVRSQTSSFVFKDRSQSLREVADQLDVNLIVEGSVVGAGSKKRISVRLLQVAGELPLWAETFDRDLKSSTDVFALLDEISRAIVNKLRLTLGRGQRRYDVDLGTYELYLKGRGLIDRRGVPDLEQAAGVFEQVLARNPAFAPAHAGLANAYALMSVPISSTLSFATAQSMLRPAALRARELDPMLAEAHAAMGWLYSREFDWDSAEKSFRRALELNPSLSQTYTSYWVSTLLPLGKLDEALRILQVALRNDSLSLAVQRDIGEVHFFARRYEEAIEALRRVVATDPDFPFARNWLGRALILAGRPAEGLALTERLEGNNLGRFKPTAPRGSWLAQAYVMTGRREDVEMLVSAHRDAPSGLAMIYAALGDSDRTFEALERMASVEPHHIGRILMQPDMAVFRGDPRLQSLRSRFGLPPLQRQ
jgi:eukaryotic-like serine/threonine-protein kinase